jgi:hypothetical protein
MNMTAGTSSSWWLIDRWEHSLTEDEANEILTISSPTFDSDDNIVEPESQIILDDEKKFLSLFNALSEQSGSPEIRIEIPMARYFKLWSGRGKSILKYFTKSERSILRKLSNRTRNKCNFRVSAQELEMLVKLACRELMFWQFSYESFSLISSYEMAFVFDFADQSTFNKVKALSNECGLFVRAVNWNGSLASVGLL